MRIEQARCHVVEMESGIRLATSYGDDPERREHVIVELVADDGATGWGEATPLSGFTGETPGTIKAVLEEHWLPLLVGANPYEGPRIHRRLGGLLTGNPSARAAIDMALHDLRARAAGLPLYADLGGHGADRVPRTYAIGIGEVGDVVAEAERWATRGYGTIKLKIGTDADADVARVRAVREALGPDVRIRVDGNAGYDVATAVAVARRLEPLDLEWIEEPFGARTDLAAWRRLRAATSTPLLADESLQSPQDALALAGERLVDGFVIKLVKTGGIHRALQIAGIAEAAGIECVVSTPFDSEIGASAALHLAFSLGTPRHSHDLPPLSLESAAEPGWAHPPVGPGLGVAGLQHREASWESELADLPA